MLNDLDRNTVNLLIAGQAEIKAEQVATNLHLGNINGSIARHFHEDMVWQREHTTEHAAKALQQAKEEGKAEGRRELRKGDIALLTAAVTLSSTIVGIAVKLL